MSTPTSPPPTIAVLAVHGVADQKPGESARAIAQMLLGVRRGLHASFTSFRELGLSLPNRRVGVERASPEADRATGSDVRPRFIRESPRGELNEPDYKFMRELLGDYRQGKGDEIYQTIRLEGARLADEDGHGEASVHIYEAYWADLSRVSDRLYRIIGEFYQLVLHLPFLGLHAIDLREHASDSEHVKWWRVHRWVYGICLWILTVPLPILNILLFALGISILPEKIDKAWHAVVTVVLAGLVALIVSGTYSYKRRVPRIPWSWLSNILTAAAVMLIVAWMVEWWPFGRGRPLYLLLGFAAWIGCGFLLKPFFRGYDRHRPGIQRWAIRLYIAITLLFAVVLLGATNSVAGLQRAMLRTLELTFFVLWAGWIILVLFTVLHLLCGWFARTTRPSFRAGSPSARALFTGMLALTLSISIFSQVTILIWALLLRTLGPILVNEDAAFRPLIFNASRDMTVKQFLEGLLSVNGPPIFVGGMILTGIVAVMAIWAMWPSIWTELRPVSPSTDAQSANRARRQGQWLTAGFGLMRLAGELVGFGILVAVGVALYTLWRSHTGQEPPWSGVLNLTPTKLFGFGAVTGTVAGLLALGRVADELALGFRPALDVLLDVDNYLRSHPHERTPRARISERYATLLRYLCRWENRSTDSTASRYDAIVIIAHSQGTVITADLLRFLRSERGKNPGFEPDLDRLLGASSAGRHLPVYFFTMGCPLRQLYRLRFPDLYRWVDAESGIGPDPTQLGVRRWVNVYRSGDYVGRSLWTPESDEVNLFLPTARPRRIDQARSEGCIGAGAHTHYWDDTAPTVAAELNHLIVEAIGAAQPAGTDR